MTSRLPNYIKTHRKRLRLSQEEVAFLLGTLNGEKVCRHERFTREPSLRSAFAYMLIFKVPPQELFAGIYDDVSRQVIGRAMTLARKQEHGERQSTGTAAINRIAESELNKPRT